MRNFSTILSLIFIFFLAGCGKKVDDNSPRKVHWDRDMCERCKMVLSDRKFAVEIVNPKTHKTYYFDDIGCAVLWLDEEKIPWKNSAKIWVKDGKTSKWIDGKKALFVEDAVTPMAYGFGAFSKENFPKDKKIYRFDEVKEMIKKIEQKNTQARGVPY